MCGGSEEKTKRVSKKKRFDAQLALLHLAYIRRVRFFARHVFEKDAWQAFKKSNNVIYIKTSFAAY